jgi:AcrR family transcriptional regulator
VARRAPKAAAKPPRRDAGRPRGETIEATILARTLDELAAHGWEGLSVERLARAAEVNKTSVYRRWPTREALVAAALEAVADRLAVELPDEGSLVAELRTLGRAVAAFAETAEGRAVLRAASAEAVGPALAAVATRRLASSALGAVPAIVARARARGEWRDDVPPEVLLAVLVGAIIHRQTLERQVVSPAWLDAVVTTLARGVRPER